MNSFLFLFSSFLQHCLLSHRFFDNFSEIPQGIYAKVKVFSAAFPQSCFPSLFLLNAFFFVLAFFIKIGSIISEKFTDYRIWVSTRFRGKTVFSRVSHFWECVILGLNIYSSSKNIFYAIIRVKTISSQKNQ